VIAIAEEMLHDTVLARKVPRARARAIAQKRDEHAAVIAPLETGG